MFTMVVRDRFSVIRPYVEKGSVLDVGCVGARPSREDSIQRIDHKPNMLFKQISELNKNVLGIDIDETGVEALRKMGHDARVADVETMDLGRKFDTIVAGEIIEHLENPGLFLRNMRRHLSDDGVLILSTPNPFYAAQTWKIWRYGKPAVHEDHMGWQDPSTMDALLRRCGLEPFDGFWVQTHSHLLKSWKRVLRPYFSSSFIRLARPSRGSGKDNGSP